jgi:selenocysteine lyase/cysteine desulfurase
MQPGIDDAARVAALREALPSTAAGIGLDVMGGGPLPAETARAMAEADEWDPRTGRAGVDRLEDLALRVEEARGVLAALLGADPAEIVLTHGVHDAIALASALCGRAELPVVEHVDASTGTTRAVGEALGTTGAWLLDAANSAGVIPFRAADTGASFVAISGERWLLGPEATGALWVAPSALTAASLASIQDALDPLPRRSVLGFARSVGWLEMYLGLPWLYVRTAAIASGLRTRLAAIDGVELLTPIDDPSAIAVFSIASWHADDAARELSARTFAILGPAVDELKLRVSVGAWNTLDELDRFSSAVAVLAAHTPDTLPRRPGLVVLGSGEQS